MSGESDPNLFKVIDLGKYRLDPSKQDEKTKELLELASAIDEILVHALDSYSGLDQDLVVGVLSNRLGEALYHIKSSYDQDRYKGLVEVCLNLARERALRQ